MWRWSVGEVLLYTYAYTHAWIYICCIYTYAWIYMLHIHICVDIYVCIYTQIHTHVCIYSLPHEHGPDVGVVT